jgi:hypothetical protein
MADAAGLLVPTATSLSSLLPTSSPSSAALLVARLVGVAVLVQSAEGFAARGAWGPGGPWCWALLRREHAGRPPAVRALLDVVGGDRGFAVVLALRLSAALVLAAAPSSSGPGRAIAAPLAFATSLWVSLRFRGRENGASDAMVNLVLLALALGPLLPVAGVVADADAAATVVVVFVAAQAVVSYVQSGVAKLGEPAWRRGRALALFAAEPRFGVPRVVRAFVDGAVAGRALAWATLAWQLGAPLAVTSTTACAVFCAVGVVFHLGNFVAFGLNRFVWAWVATWPALLWCSARFGAPSGG